VKHITPTEIARLQEISRRFEKVVGEDQVWAYSVQDCSDVFVTGRLRTTQRRPMEGVRDFRSSTSATSGWLAS